MSIDKRNKLIHKVIDKINDAIDLIEELVDEDADWDESEFDIQEVTDIADTLADLNDSLRSNT